MNPTERWPRDEPRHFVFPRTGEPCLRCGARIELFRQGDFPSLTYWCPRCQAAGRRLPAGAHAPHSGA